MAAILLVEPHAELLEVARDALAAMGHRVHVETRGAGAARWSARSTERVDLLVAEVELPDFSAIHVVEHLRSSRPELAVLLIAWRKREHLRALGHAVGDLPVMQKPLRLRDFQARIQALLDDRQQGAGEPPSAVVPMPRQSL